MTRFEYINGVTGDLELCEVAKIFENFSKEKITNDYDIENWLCEEMKEEDLYIMEE